MNKISAVSLVFAIALPAQAATLKGVSMPDTISVTGKEAKEIEVSTGTGKAVKKTRKTEMVEVKKDLVLNGQGLRSKMGFKVYVGGLYLEQKSQDGQAIIASNAIKRIDMQFLRDVGREKLVETWNENFKKYCKDGCVAANQAKFEQFIGSHYDVKENDQLSYTFFPNRIEYSIRGEKAAPIEGADFQRVILSAWLGADPGDEDLQDGLLGKK